jgi:hypothetical protein
MISDWSLLLAGSFYLSYYWMLFTVMYTLLQLLLESSVVYFIGRRCLVGLLGYILILRTA